MSRRHRMQEEEFSGQLRWDAWRRVGMLFWEQRVWILLFLGSAGMLAVIDALLPYVMARVFDGLREGSELRVILGWAGVYAVLSVVMAGLIFALIRSAGRASTAIAYAIREQGFRRLQELPVAYHDTRSVGWLVSRLTTDCEKVANTALWFCCDLTWGIGVILFSAVMMLAMRWQLALMVLVVLPLLGVVTRFFQVRLLKASRDTSRYGSLVTGRHTENINGVLTTRVLVREKPNLADFEELNQVLASASIRHGVLSAAYMPVVFGIGGGAVAVVLYLGGVQTLDGQMSLGEWVAFMSYAMMTVFPVLEISRQVAELQRAQAAVERIGSLLDTEPEIRDSRAVRERIAAVREAGAPPESDGLEDEVAQIEFRDVTFSYVKGHPVLSGIDFKAERGEVVALVGPTGGGKSTLVQLACRFYEPDSGQILVNGRDYRERGLQWLQSRLGFVLQEPQLFSGSVADNIRYGRLEATDEEVREAARTVSADGFISELEQGYGTLVGEGGVRLSSGQRQLISFARAVLADPSVFVMDEATASVDSETEALIQDALGSVLSGRISFVIAHRLSTVRHADQVLFIDKGRIVERGTHQSLMRARGRYFKMYTSQFQRYTIDHWDQGMEQKESDG